MSCVKAFKSPAALLAASALACGLWAQEPAAAPSVQKELPASAAAPKAAAPAPAPVANAVSANATETQAKAQDPDSLESINSRLRSLKKSQDEAEVKIVESTRRIRDMLDNYSKAERNLTGFNGLGRVEQLELKAELYGGERLARKRLSEEFSILSGAVDDWTAFKGKRIEVMRLLAMRMKMDEIQKSSSSSASAKPASGGIQDIEYYQVKKAADLRAISSYPEVYGTPEFWDYLYKANKDKISDPDKPVPAGTTLIVPQDVKKLPDFNDL